LEVTERDIPYLLLLESIFLALFILSPYNILKLIAGLVSLLFIPGYSLVILLSKARKLILVLNLSILTGFLYLSSISYFLQFFKLPNYLLPIISLLVTFLLYIKERYSLEGLKESLNLILLIVFTSSLVTITFGYFNILLPKGHINLPDLPFFYLSGDEFLASLTYSILSYNLLLSSTFLFLSSINLKLSRLGIIFILLLPSITYLVGYGYSDYLSLLAFTFTFFYLKDNLRYLFGFYLAIVYPFSALILTPYLIKDKYNLPLAALFISNFLLNPSIPSLTSLPLDFNYFLLLTPLSVVGLTVFIKDKINFLFLLIPPLLLSIFFKFFYLFFIYPLALTAVIALLNIIPSLRKNFVSIIFIFYFLVIFSYFIPYGLQSLYLAAEDSKDIQAYVKDAKPLMESIRRDIALNKTLLVKGELYEILKSFNRGKSIGSIEILNQGEIKNLFYSNYEFYLGDVKLGEQMPNYPLQFIALKDEEIFYLNDLQNHLILYNKSYINLSSLERSEVNFKDKGISYYFYNSWLKVFKQLEVRGENLTITYLALDYSGTLDTLKIHLSSPLKNLTKINDKEIMVNRKIILNFDGNVLSSEIKDGGIDVIFKKEKNTILGRINLKLEGEKEVKSLNLLELAKSKGKVYLILPKEDNINRFLGFKKFFEGEGLIAFTLD